MHCHVKEQEILLFCCAHTFLHQAFSEPLSDVSQLVAKLDGIPCLTYMQYGNRASMRHGLQYSQKQLCNSTLQLVGPKSSGFTTTGKNPRCLGEKQPNYLGCLQENSIQIHLKHSTVSPDQKPRSLCLSEAYIYLKKSLLDNPLSYLSHPRL